MLSSVGIHACACRLRVKRGGRRRFNGWRCARSSLRGALGVSSTRNKGAFARKAPVRTVARAGACGLLSGSYARGRIYGDKAVPPNGKTLDGHIVTVYTGACALIGVKAGAGAGLQVEMKIPFSGTRL